jgi:phosphate transport system substrate-binding protein
VKITQSACIAAVAALGAVALAGCGSDNNTTSSTSSTSGTTSSAGSSSSSGSDTGTAAADCPSGTLNAEGSSAQKNAFEEVVAAYNEKCPDLTVNYNPSGSGTGVKQFNASLVDFAGSDSALKTEEKDGVIEVDAAKKRCGSDAWNLPMVVGPISVAYNLPGVDKVVLTPALLSGIFQGEITTWNDAKIAAANPGVTLPGTAIKPFFRSDESGTTDNFTKYLKAAGGDAWKADPGKVWTGKGEGKEKSSGVADAVKSTEGGVTYVEWSYAKDNGLSMAQIDNGSGAVELTADSVGKFIAAAQADGQGNDLRLKLDYATKEAGAYPIGLVTYEIVCSKNSDAAKQAAIKSFLGFFAQGDTQKSLEDLGYAPLPADLQTKVAAAVAALS